MSLPTGRLDQLAFYRENVETALDLCGQGAELLHLGFRKQTSHYFTTSRDGVDRF
jgi:hypothetical protein